jgi:hypothetical protein
MKAEPTVEVMPDIPNTPEDQINSKKTKKYVKQAMDSQKKDKINITGNPRST